MKRATSEAGFDCINSFDYPSIPDDKWVIWTSYGRWPDPDRTVRYLSTKTSAAGAALLSPFHRNARRWDTEAEAREWLAEQNKLRPTPWELNVTTVQALKLHCGYYVED